MGCENQDVLVVADLQQHSAKKQTCREIELPFCFCLNSIPHLSFALSFGERAQVGYW